MLGRIGRGQRRGLRRAGAAPPRPGGRCAAEADPTPATGTGCGAGRPLPSGGGGDERLSWCRRSANRSPRHSRPVAEGAAARRWPQDEPLVELETDKVTLEVNAPAAGVLGSIAGRGRAATVEVGAELGHRAGRGASGGAGGSCAGFSPKPRPPPSARGDGCRPHRRRPEASAPAAAAGPRSGRHSAQRPRRARHQGRPPELPGLPRGRRRRRCRPRCARWWRSRTSTPAVIPASGPGRAPDQGGRARLHRGQDAGGVAALYRTRGPCRPSCVDCSPGACSPGRRRPQPAHRARSGCA